MNGINLFAIFAIVNGLVSATFGILIIAKNWHNRINRIFFSLTVVLTVWSFSYWQWQIATQYADAFMWVRILAFASLFIPIIFYHWVIFLINAKTFVNKTILFLGYGMAFIILPFINSPLFISGISPKLIFKFWPSSGFIYDIYFVYLYIGIIGYALYLLIHAYQSTEEKDKKGQIAYIISGSVIGFGGALTNFPLWWNIPILPYGNIFVAFFPFLLGYSVIKYHLFNVRTIFAEMAAFVLIVFMLIIVLLADNEMLRFIYSLFLILTVTISIILVKSSYTLENLVVRQETLIHFISHEVKGFLTRDANAMAMLSEGDFGALPSDAKSFVEGALTQTRSGVRSVLSILQAANLKKGEVEYNMTSFDLAALVKKSFAALQHTAQGKGLSFTLSIDQQAEPYTVIGDADQLSEHVFRNIIENAILYTQKGSVSVALGKSNKGKIVFSIKDTGVGISDEDKKRLFTEGGHGKDSIKVNAHSTGYGLYIVKQVIEAHHGTVRALSEGSGSGSRFVVELPAVS